MILKGVHIGTKGDTRNVDYSSHGTWTGTLSIDDGPLHRGLRGVQSDLGI